MTTFIKVGYFYYFIIMITLNQITLIGRVGTKVDLKETVSGDKKVVRATFTLATSYPTGTLDANGKRVYGTDWHNILLWGKNADIAGKWLNRGDRVWISGRSSTRVYVGEDKVKKAYTEVIGRSIGLIEGKKVEVSAGVPARAIEPALPATFGNVVDGGVA